MSFLATIKALQDGDSKNFDMAIMPGGIECQEARGNLAFVANSTLPKCQGKDKEYLEQMGIVFGEDADDLFVNVQLPDGWGKQRGEDSRYSYLVDDKGNRRASIFYKAAFYNRYASISLMRRYSAKYIPVEGYESRKTTNWVGIATDKGIEIWRSAELGSEPPSQGDSRQAWLDWCNARNTLSSVAASWLDENYPDWRSPAAYW